MIWFDVATQVREIANICIAHVRAPDGIEACDGMLTLTFPFCYIFAPGMNLTERTEVELIVLGFTVTDADVIAKVYCRWSKELP